jgi:hypothetical protein
MDFYDLHRVKSDVLKEKDLFKYADDPAAYQERKKCKGVQDSVSGAGKMPAEAGCLHSCLHNNTEKAELRVAKSCACEAFQ